MWLLDLKTLEYVLILIVVFPVLGNKLHPLYQAQREDGGSLVWGFKHPGSAAVLRCVFTDHVSRSINQNQDVVAAIVIFWLSTISFNEYVTF